MNLYLKYRPDNLEDILGNGKIVMYLERALENPPNAFMLHGPAGCGKTTIARIIANNLTDEHNIIEMNSASFRGIDTIRDLINKSRYHGVGGKKKVYVLDEVHKFTNDAQTAMLKLIEEPPADTHFVLCTTEVNKVLKTVRDRCIDLQVEPLDDEDMLSLLLYIVGEEKAKIKQDDVRKIVAMSEGRPRKAIQILEQFIELDEPSRESFIIGLEDEERTSIELCRALLKMESWKKISTILKGLKGQDAESIRRHVLGYAQSVLLNGADDRAAFIIEAFYEPLYNVGFPGLVFCCYTVIKG